MRILITTDWYKPVINGVVTSVINLAKGLEQEGHEVRVLTLSETSRSYKKDGVYYIGSLGIGAIYPQARVAVTMGKKYLEEIISWEPEVIHTQCEFSTFYLAKRISERTKAPIIHTYHTVYEGYTHYFCPSKKYGKKLVEAFTRRISRMSDCFVVPSDKMESMLSEYNIVSPMHVIPSGIDLDRFSEKDDDVRTRLRHEWGIGDEECLLIYIGRLAKEKNLEEILDFLSNDKLTDARMLIVGDGPYREKLEAISVSKGLSERVIFTGMVKPESVADYYKVGDIFISASTSETQGLTYIEAMASGLALLCRYDDCLEAVITQGKNGFTYNNQIQFEEKLNFLFYDARRRNEMGSRARRDVMEKYSIKTFAVACVEVYLKCISVRLRSAA